MNRSAVIDIGSNSVRLVIYRIVRSAAVPHFNEKVMAGLGRGLTETGRLSQQGCIAALSSLERFQAILRAMRITQIYPVATAAVREASDGQEFVASAEDILKVPIRVVSGEDEARLSALGVVSGTFAADGVTGDLGGSSLEFSQISDGTPSNGETHLLGPLSIGLSQTIKQRRRIVKSMLQGSPIIADRPGGVFYAVGGAWRALAKLHMHHENYPLMTLHGYRMDAREVSQFTRQVIVGSPVMQSHIREITGRHPDVIRHAAMVLQQVFELGDFEQLYISANGIREGILAEAGLAERGDPFIDGIAATAHLDSSQYAFGDALHRFVREVLPIDGDLFGSSNKQDRIDRAACMLADSGARLHPDHRADLAYDLALRGGYTGATHAQRAFVALAVGCRYYKSFRRPKPHCSLMPQPRADRARQLGALMRLGAVFSGRSAPLLEHAALLRADDQLVLLVDQSQAAMVSDTVEKRLSQAARHMLLEPEIRYRRG